MLSADENKPIGKSGQRKRNKKQEGNKAEPRRRKSAQQRDPQQDKDPRGVVSAPIPSTEIVPADISFTDSSPAIPITSAKTIPVSYQTIATAYCNYTLQSLDHTRAFFEKLAGVRSLDKMLELQAEFTRQACEGFATETKKIGELHGELARQRLQRWEAFVAGMIIPR
ncbi:MAG TPA: phasin family protein [Bradyrhizobium sp.]|nr:phasin family protein [Bradyrhizobium sp.]